MFVWFGKDYFGDGGDQSNPKVVEVMSIVEGDDKIEVGFEVFGVFSMVEGVRVVFPMMVDSMRLTLLITSGSLTNEKIGGFFFLFFKLSRKI